MKSETLVDNNPVKAPKQQFQKRNSSHQRPNPNNSGKKNNKASSQSGFRNY